ncbi:L-lactate dehydrogenase [Clostridium thermosuccinogenes]|jgi:L-lactate dehydrogenase|uniref:L-lactate dehydrogenase n=1 Tax=Clostridium thermosuccinogenes TaxID=84032 RepID=A0A2K2FG72_9CLOT|nr:L-lactate dehydrogenase [Pseudoclostridium thermosuccinogenes]AUS96443.1 L-lactate dehydrogenase [Pseudoclostridium thermosuccinogenes]PNT97785.1 L-lactate dehydrogenase [Pseudoclostridium thermosuccinogenes]PNT99775.1 L-lactate dehydrogenase [Pseudoclostridium thermosuccinogenes]
MHEITPKKITVVGAGFVGSTTAYTLMLSGLVSEIVLIDINKDKAEGEVMDMNHGMPFVRPVKIYQGSYSDCAGSDIIIISAGANQKPGETRIDLVYKNTEIFKSIIGEILKYNTDCILLVVTNPVDILTYVTYKISGFPKNRVIGSGTVLDTARLRYLIGDHVNIDTRNVHAYIIGEHGDTEVAAWSTASIGNIPMDKYCEDCRNCPENIRRQDIYNEVKNAAYKIIEKKGATYYAVALAVRRIVEAILRNENSILTVSSLLEGQYGINDICLSLPTVVNHSGIVRILDMPLDDTEMELLKKSANSLKEIAGKLKL